ncbi:MAG: hypothetical protein V2B19_27475 [Pseudomonadota bacterium]
MSKIFTSDPGNPAIKIDFFRVEDAPGVARLFREVYGDGYPISTYYIPDRLVEENAAGRIISSVARTPAGEVVGHNALVLMDPGTDYYENAAGAVLPAYNGQGIFSALFKHTLVNTSKSFNIEGIVGEPVCNHTSTQKMCLQLGFKESGLEVELMPAAAYGKEQGASNRVSVLLGFFMLKPRAQTVHIPLAYRDELEYLYAGLAVERTPMFSGDEMPAAGNSQGSMKLFESAQVARITIDGIGPDFELFLARLESEACEKGAVIFQVWLTLASPFTSAATEILRKHGYFLGGVSPCGRNGDTLLMQKVCQEPVWENIALYSERAKKIGDMIRRDWQSITESQMGA